jgi:hypothetical protein
MSQKPATRFEAYELVVMSCDVIGLLLSVRNNKTLCSSEGNAPAPYGGSSVLLGLISATASILLNFPVAMNRELC